MVTPIKYLKVSLILPLLIFLYGCPDENDCNDIMTGGIAEVPGLVTIEPLQETYQKSDELILRCSVPAVNNYFGEEINLHEETQANFALLTLAQMIEYLRIFESDNELQFIKGTQGEYPNWMKMAYNPDNANYELEVIIKLNTIGEYGIRSYSKIELQGNSNCNRYRLDSSIVGAVNGEIHFTVVE
jgi:hypothetical protein